MKAGWLISRKSQGSDHSFVCNRRSTPIINVSGLIWGKQKQRVLGELVVLGFVVTRFCKNLLHEQTLEMLLYPSAWERFASSARCCCFSCLSFWLNLEYNRIIASSTANLPNLLWIIFARCCRVFCIVLGIPREKCKWWHWIAQLSATADKIWEPSPCLSPTASDFTCCHVFRLAIVLYS